MDNLRQSWESWLDTAVGGIRFGYDRRAVRAELCAHLEDKAADLQRIFPDMTAEEAEARALGEMGDAEELRSALAKIHRPWLGYLWRASQAALALLLLVLAISGANAVLVEGGLGGWYCPGKDWQVDESSTVLLNPVEEEVNVEGSSITVPQALIWKAGEEKELRAVLRVEDLRFWRKSGRQLQLMSARDDLGRYYISTYEESRFDGQWQQGYAAVEQNGWGPFHQTYLLRVSCIAPEARWIELNYDCLGRSFSLRIDLTEEAEA